MRTSAEIVVMIKDIDNAVDYIQNRPDSRALDEERRELLTNREKLVKIWLWVQSNERNIDGLMSQSATIINKLASAACRAASAEVHKKI